MASAGCQGIRGACIAGKPGSYPVGAGLPAIASARCQRVRGVYIAGKPGAYRWEQACLRWGQWGVRAFAAPTGGSWLACDGVSGVSGHSRRLHRGQTRLLQVGAGLPAMASAGFQGIRGGCIAGKPRSYSGSWLACDGVGGVSGHSRRLHRGQARRLQVGAGLPAMASAGFQGIRGVCIAGKPGPYRWEQACLRWGQWGVRAFEAAASRASPAPTGGSRLACDGVGGVSGHSRRLHRGQARRLQVGAGLPAMASAGFQGIRGVCIAGKPGSYRDPRRTRSGIVENL